MAETQDRLFSEALKIFSDKSKESKTFLFAPDIVDEIMKSKQEIRKGLFIENDQFEKEIEEWLNEK